MTDLELLELIFTRLVSNLQQSSCFYLLRAGIIGL